MIDQSIAAYVAVNAVGFAGAIVLLRMLTRRTHDWLTFAHLFSVVWGANILAGQFALQGRLRPEVATLAILFGAWWMFLGAAVWVSASRPGGPMAGSSTAPTVDIEKVSGIAVLLTLIALQLTAFAFEVGTQQLSLGTFLGNLWTTGVEFRQDDVYSAVEYPFSFSVWRWGHVFYIPLAFCLHANRLISGKAVAVVLGLAAVMAFGRYTRAPVLQVAIISLVCWVYLYRPSRRAKLIVGASIGTVAALAFIVSQINLMAAYAPTETTPFESVFAYVGGSPLAYQALLHGDVTPEPGVLYSLDVLNYALYKLSLLDVYIGVIRPYADLPLRTNIYTFLDAYTLDAGIAGALAGSFITAGLVALVFKRTTTRPTYANLTLYAYLAYCCVMAVANNEFIRAGVFITAGLAWGIGRLVRVRQGTVGRVVPLVRAS